MIWQSFEIPEYLATPYQPPTIP